MPWLWLLIELFVELLAVWTLVVHGAMALGTPAWWAWPAFFVVALVLAFAARGRLSAARQADAAELRFALSVLGLGGIAALPALVLLTPSGDDFNFFHRAFWQVAHLGEPFALGDTAFGVPGLAAISPLHAITTWEFGLALAGRALGLDALGVYHNGAVVLGNGLVAAVVGLWLRELGFGARAALAGVVASLAFFYLDDPSIRSWAIAYRMLWVGKMVQWLVVLPAALLFAWRYLRAPSVARLWHPAACAVCAVATSGTGVFLLPGVFAAASLAGVALGPFGWHRVWLCGLLNVASLYCFGVAGLVLAGVLPQPEDMRAWTEGFPSHWLENLALVVPHPGVLVRNTFLALAVPAVLLRGAPRNFLVGFGLALIVIFLNPLTGPRWLSAAQPGSYWRVMLLFPVPLGAGIACAAWVSSRPSRRVALGMAVLVAASLAAPWIARPTGFAFMQHRYEWKLPLEVRLPATELRFVRRARAELEGRSLLAAQGVSVTAALTVPGLRIEAARLQDTRHVFSNAGNPNEGIRRLKAWDWASRCDGTTGEAAARISLEQGVDAFIGVDCGAGEAARRQPVLQHDGARFVEVLREDGYVLYLRR